MFTLMEDPPRRSLMSGVTPFKPHVLLSCSYYNLIQSSVTLTSDQISNCVIWYQFLTLVIEYFIQLCQGFVTGTILIVIVIVMMHGYAKKLHRSRENAGE